MKTYKDFILKDLGKFFLYFVYLFNFGVTLPLDFVHAPSGGRAPQFGNPCNREITSSVSTISYKIQRRNS